MRKFTNPLDSFHIASPCSANWEEMYGSERKRFCGDCKLNVYNLSNMTRQEAENLLLTSEGRLCVRFFRRADGTVLTKNCPVGWQAVKRRVSRVATAAFSIFAGLFTGVMGFNFLGRQMKPTVGQIEIMGDVAYPAMPGGISPMTRDDVFDYEVVGQRVKPEIPTRRTSERK